MDPNIFTKARYFDAAEDGSNLSDLLHVDASEDEDDDASEDEKNPLFITDLDPLHCQNNGCSNPLKVPIRQCLSGHLFCFDCHQGQLNCMLCSENKLFPALAADAILNAIMNVCPNKILGCNEKFPFYEFHNHVNERCKFRDHN